MKELIIVGGGPAGLAASIYAARKKIDFSLFTVNIGGQALWGSNVENYLGYHMVSGSALVKKFNEHVDYFNIDKYFDEVRQIQHENNHFSVEAKSGKILDSISVIFATGKRPKLLMVPGEKEFHGRGVTYCSTCDAPLFSGMPTLVIGGGNSGLEAALQLSRISPKVYLVTNEELSGDKVVQHKLRQKENVEIITFASVKEITGGKFVEGVVIETSKGSVDLSVKGVFIEIGAVPNCSLVRNLVELNKKMEIKVNCSNETKTAGLFAAGDVTSVPEKQIIIAAGEGAKAALSAYSYICRC